MTVIANSIGKAKVCYREYVITLGILKVKNEKKQQPE